MPRRPAGRVAAADLEAVRAASERLLGLHDFAAFCRRREGATTIREVQDLRVERDPEGIVRVQIRADAFCHHMVRSLVGALLGVGEGRRPESWPAEVLAARTRESSTRDGAGAAPLCPPQGLTLDHVAYPPDEELAAWAARTRTLSAGQIAERPAMERRLADVQGDVDNPVTVNLNGPATPEAANDIAAAVRREVERALAEAGRREQLARRAALIDGGMA